MNEITVQELKEKKDYRDELSNMPLSKAGEIIYQKTGVEDVFTYTLTMERLEEARSKYPFWRDADQFHILINNQPEV